MATIAGQQQISGNEEMAIEQSSFLQAASYIPASNQLIITFKNGGQHSYFMVFPNIWQAFKEAPSKGKFYAENIKGKYGSQKIVDKTVGASVKGTRFRVSIKK